MSVFRLRIPLVALLAGALHLTPACADHVDPDQGFSFKPPAKWDEIPVPAGTRMEGVDEKQALVMVAKYKAKNPDLDNFSIDLEVYRIDGKKASEEACEEYCTHAMDTRKAKLDRLQPLAQGKAKGMRYWFTAREFGHDAAVLFQDGKAFAVEFTAGVRGIKKLEKEISACLASFQIMTAEEILKLKGGKGPDKRDSEGTRLPQGWSLFKSDHYDIAYNTEEAFARTVGMHLENIIRKYMEIYPPEEMVDEKSGRTAKLERFFVKVFKSEEQFNAYASANGVSGAMAYFSPSQKELVCYKTVDEGKKTTFNVMYHEAMHQYLHFYLGADVDIPTWLNEGMGDYFYGGEFKDARTFVISKNRERHPVILEAIHTGTFVPLKQIFQYTQAQYYANAGLCYAEGWGIVYFLWRTDNAAYQGVIRRYIDTLRRTKDGKGAFSAGFGALDLDRMERDWIEFMKRA